MGECEVCYDVGALTPLYSRLSEYATFLCDECYSKVAEEGVEC